jgi:hypothetical protein
MAGSSEAPSRLVDGLSARPLVMLISALCLLVLMIELAAIPPLSRQWGLTFWFYLHPAVSVSLAACVVALLVPQVRRSLVGLCGRIPWNRRLGLSLFVVLTLVMWIVRSRYAYGDSRIFFFWMNTSPALFVFPDIGATFLLKASHMAGKASGIGGLELVQALIILCGPLAMYFFYRAARLLAPNETGALLIVALVFSSGMARVFSGHLEVYAFVIVSLGAYLWAGLAFLAGRCGWVPVSLAFGFGLWVHVQYLFLSPSIMLLFVLVEPGRSLGHYLKCWIPAGLVTLAPTAAFFLLLLVTGHGQDLEAAVEKMLHWSDVGPTPEGHEAWIRLWGGSGPGTLYMILGPGHLKYLINTFFVLAPWTFVLLAWLASRVPRRFVSGKQALFLGCACSMAVLYALIVRPVYGPYDWDLFSLTAALATLLAGHLLVTSMPRQGFSDLAALLIGSALLFTAIPFLIVGFSPRADAGPFATDQARPVPGERFEDSFNRLIEPWL